MGYFILIATAIVGAVVFPWPAGADHVAGEDPYFTCRGSVARATLLEGQLLRTVEPLAANSNREECAEDTSGVPTITLPPAGDPSPVPPFVFAKAVQANTEILCADDDPDPNVTEENNDLCDAGRRSFEQQVLSTADAADVRIALGAEQGVPAGVEIIAQAANTSARARCGPGNVPVLSGTSNVLNLVVKVGGLEIPIQQPPPNEQAVINLPGDLGRITLNERIVTQPGLQPNQPAGGPFAYEDNAAAGQITQRAIHVEIPGGAEPGSGSIADVVVAESIADFHGDVCPEGRVVVRKQTAPEEDPNSTLFGFTAGPGLTGPTSDFDLRDDEEQVLQGGAASISQGEVLPGTYTVTEDAPGNNYVLTGINCVERTETGSTTNVANRTATVVVDPGETATCTFVNARQPTCPDGSAPVNGTCPGAVTCPGGITPQPNGTCPGTVTCPGGITPTNGTCPGTVTCPFGITPTNGQCLVTNVQCPAGTTFNPVTRGCSESPRGGTLVPLNIPALQNLFRASPCVGQGFGALLGIIGTNGPDRITGTNISDRIFALGGNDRASGGRGDDCVEGGSGRDVIDGSNGNDFLLGGTEGDQIVGGPGRDRLSGGSGRDGLSGASGNDVIRGGGGRDRMNGGFGNDRQFGGPGNDGIHTGNGKDFVSAGSGNDIINAATRAPAAFVDCGPGKDRVRINKNERRRIRNCEFVDITRRIRGR